MVAGQLDSAHDIGATSPAAAASVGRDCPACQIAEMFSVMGIFSLGFRTEGEGAAFADKRARLAVGKAIDWQALIKNAHDDAAILPPTTNITSLIFEDTPSVARNAQLLREAGVKDEDNVFVFDPARAKQLWAASGHKEGEKHSITYNEYTTQPVTKQFIAIASELKKNLNIEVEVNKATDINVYYNAIGYLGGQKHQNFPSMALYVTTVSPTNAGAINYLKPGRQLNLPEINNPRINLLADEIAKGVPLAQEKSISREVWVIEQRDEIKRLTLPAGARYIVYGPRLRNAYQQSRGGEAFHQGGHLVELIWLDR
jgi:ABC-type transport system substrate-binding protein